MSGPVQNVSFLAPAQITALTTGLQAQITSMSGSVATLNSQVTSMSGSIATINTQVTSMSGAVALLNLRDNYSLPQTQAVYNTAGNKRLNFATIPGIDSTYNLQGPIQQEQYTISLPVNYTYTGTELFTGANSAVYGYTGTSVTTLSTGTSGVYNYTGSFTQVNYTVSAPNDYYLSSAPMMKREYVEEQYKQITSYFQQRGYTFGSQVLSPSKSNYFLNFGFNSNAAFEWTIQIKPVYNPTGGITSVNLGCNLINRAQLAANFISANSDPSVFKPFLSNMFNISNVTTNFTTYQTAVNNNTTVVYNDLQSGVLNFFVSSTGTTDSFYKVFEMPINPTGSIPFTPTGTYTNYTNKFIGSFACVTRNPVTNVLDFTNYVPEGLGYVQVSQSVIMQSTMTLNGTPLASSSLTIPIRGNGYNNYNGLILPTVNYSVNNSYPVQIVPWNILLGSVSPGNESVFQSNPVGQAQSNYITNNIGSTTTLTVGAWSGLAAQAFTIDVDFIQNPGFPETLPSLPSGTITSSLNYDDYILLKHEFVHGSQAAQLSYAALSCENIEGNATAIELDEKLSLGSTWKNSFMSWTYLIPHYRGAWGYQFQNNFFTNTRYTNPNPYMISTNQSYGEGMATDFIHRKVDPNYQVFRRAQDLLSQGDFATLVKKDNYDYLVSSLLSYNNVLNNFPYGYKQNGFLLAMNQAMQELTDTNLTDIYTDWAIASCILRNNLSIPEKYRIDYPWWIFSATNPTNMQNLLVEVPNNRDSDCAYFWDQIQNPTGPQNNPSINTLSASVNAESLFPSWPRTTGASGITRAYNATGAYVSSFTGAMVDMSTLAFTIPTDFNTVAVTCNTGVISATMLNFEPDGGNTGTFLMTGPHSIAAGSTFTFDATPFHALTNGYTRLVVVNTNIQDLSGLYGGWGNYISNTYIYTGQVVINVS